MSMTGLALLITSIGTLLTSVTAAYIALLGLRRSNSNSVQIQEVHKLANGLSQRNEDIAKKLGIAEGKASEKANPS